RLDDTVAVFDTASLDVQLEFDLADRQFGRVPGVNHFNDVRILLGNDARCANELAGNVGKQDAQLRVPCRCGEAVADHSLQQQRVNIAARENRRGDPGRLDLAGEHRGDTRSA